MGVEVGLAHYRWGSICRFKLESCQHKVNDT